MKVVKSIIFVVTIFLNLNIQSMDFSQALTAVRSGDMNMVLYYLNNEDFAEFVLRYLLFQAVYSNRYDIAELLIMRGADVNSKYPLVGIALENENKEMVELLLRNHARYIKPEKIILNLPTSAISDIHKININVFSKIK